MSQAPTKPLVGNIADAVAAEDLREIEQAAHALKGVCAQFAATEVRDLAGYLETEATDLSEIQAVMIDLNRALEVLDLNLAARCAGFSHPVSG